MRRALSMICALALTLGMIVPWSGHVHATEVTEPAVTTACPYCDVPVTEWETLTADTVWEPGNHYRLTDRLELSQIVNLDTAEEAGTYCIDLAGHTLINPNNRTFLLGKSGGTVSVTVNIMDTSLAKSGRVEGFWGKGTSGGVVYMYSGATMNIYGGTFASANASQASANNGGVFQILSGATVNMYGGSIEGGTAGTRGGAINVAAGATFYMNGGTVKAGTAPTAACIYAESGAAVKLSGTAAVDEIYFAGSPAANLTISNTYTGSVTLNAATAIVSGNTIAKSDNADISGATITIASDAELRSSVSGTSIVVSKMFWCEACEDYFAWKSLSATLPADASGHYRLSKNVSASQVVITADREICLDLAGHTYTGAKRAFILGSSTAANNITLNIMDSSTEKTGVFQANGGSGQVGGVIYAYKQTEINLYNITMKQTASGDAKNGGVIATLGAVSVNMYGGTIHGGKATGTGAAVNISGTSTLKVVDGVITSGTVSATPCVNVESGGVVELSGNASVEEIYFAGSSAAKLKISGNYSGKTNLRFATTPAADADIGNCENATIGKESIAIFGTRMFAAVSGTNLVATTLQGASVTTDEGVTYYDTLAQAVTGYTTGTVKLLADNSETVTLPGGMILDLNGWDLSGNVTVSGGKVYVKDTATDDYDVDDIAGYGQIPVVLKNYAEPVENYLEVEEETGVSFHRYILKLNKVNLRPSVTGLYYTADVKLSSTVLDKIDSYGIAVSTGSKNPALEDTKTLYTAIAPEDYSAAGTNSVLINAVMDPAAPAADNTVYATTVVYGRPYIKFKDGTMAPFYGDVCATSLQQLTEAVEQVAWDRLSLPQSRGLTAMYEAYEDVTAAWNLPSVEKANTAATDKDLKVLIIGNSHGLDSTNLLYEVFNKEGLPEGYEHVTLGAIYTGGCSVSSHAKNALGDLPYDYWMKNDGSKADGSWIKTEDPTMRQVLEDEDWDVVLLQEMNTVSAVASNFRNDNIETVFNFVVNTLGYEPEFMWNMIWANPEIPEAYVNYLGLGEGTGGDGEVGSGSEGDDNEVSDALTEAKKRAWIFQTQNPGGYATSWPSNYVDYWKNNRQEMYNKIVSNVKNYVFGKSVHNINADEVMPNATAIQYAIEWMGMHEQDMYRDYTHVSDLGRLMVAYLWYAKLTGKTSIEAPKYTLVSKVLENSRQPLGYARDWSAYSDVIKESVNFALADPYGAIQNYTYAEYLALTPDLQAAYEASFDAFSVHSGWTFRKWLEQAVTGVTYTDYTRMTAEQQTAFQNLCADFDTWYAGVAENLTYTEYFILTGDEKIAYADLRGEAFGAWLTDASAAFTYTDYVMLTYDQQEAYQATFAEGEFDTWFAEKKAGMTYEEYMDLTMHQKLQYRKTYSSIANFLVWYEAAKAAYEA